jgi:hypothetical protein
MRAYSSGNEADIIPREKMGLKSAFARLLRMGEPGPETDEGPISIVLLLREPTFPTLERLQELGEKAFGRPFSGDRTARHSVYVRGVLFTLANVGEHKLSFLFMTKPYADDSESARRYGKSLKRSDQRQAWSKHKAYIAIDYVQGRLDNDLKYVVLARLCAQIYDENCVALYLPAESALVPGGNAARKQLDKIIAYRNVDVS